MATERPLSYHHYYQIVSKSRSKSSDSLTRRDQTNPAFPKTTNTKEPPILSTGSEAKPLPTIRRRFSLFRSKRSAQSNETINAQALQQIIYQLRVDLQRKNDELDAMKARIEHRRNPNIAQAMQFQTMLNGKLRELLAENDLLKRSIEELESFAQQNKGKSERKVQV